MARASATWTNTDADHFKAGLTGSASILAYWLTDVLQNIEWIAQSHNHDGGTADGGQFWTTAPGTKLATALGAF